MYVAAPQVNWSVALKRTRVESEVAGHTYMASTCALLSLHAGLNRKMATPTRHFVPALASLPARGR